jgi:hypothetical protein
LEGTAVQITEEPLRTAPSAILVEIVFATELCVELDFGAFETVTVIVRSAVELSA